MRILQIPDDGNCLFSSLATIFKNPNIDHKIIRKMIVHYIYQNPEVFQNDIIAEEYENIEHYCYNMSRIGFWGDGICLQAFSMLFQLNVLLCYDEDPNTVLTHIGDYKNRPNIGLILQGEHYSRILSW